MSAAFRANSDRRGCAAPAAEALLCASLSSLWEPGFAACLRRAAVTMWRNSDVRSLMATAMAADATATVARFRMEISTACSMQLLAAVFDGILGCDSGVGGVVVVFRTRVAQ